MRAILAICLLLLAGPVLAEPPAAPRVSGRLQLLAAEDDGLLVDAAWIGLDGGLRHDLTYRLLWDLGRADGDVKAKTLRLDWRPASALRLRAGLFRTPYGRQAQLSGKRLQAIERPAALDGFLPGRDLGAALAWTPSNGPATLSAGVFNGTGDALSGDDARRRPLRVLRAEWRLGGGAGNAESDLEVSRRPRLSLGLGVADTEDAGPTADGYPRTVAGRRESAGLDAALAWRGLYLAAEAHRARLEPDAEPVRTAEGLALQAGWYFPGPRLEPRVAWDRFDPDRARPGDAERTWTWGLNWYAEGRRTMIRLDYVDRRAPRPGAPDWNDDSLRAQVQLLFG